MRHYWMGAKNEVGEYDILDTVDLTIERVKFEDFCHLIRKSFINVFQCSQEELKHVRRNIDLEMYMDKQLSAMVSRPFKFPVKNGLIDYDGNKLNITFMGKQYSIRPTRPQASTVTYDYMLFDDYIMCASPSTRLIVGHIVYQYNTMIICFFFEEIHGSFYLYLNYVTGKVSVRYNHGDGMEVCQDINTFLQSVVDNINNNLIFLRTENPELLRDLLLESYRLPNTNRKLALEVIMAYAEHISLIPEITRFNIDAMFKEYSDICGVTKEDKVRFSKLLFLGGGKE